MTDEDLRRIKEHIEIHAKREPRALIITRVLQRAVAELEKEKWHYPSKGELPDYEGFYLIFTKKQAWIIGEYEIVEGVGEWYDDSGSCEPLEDRDKVIAWRYLPEPPKKD